ncbi:MULTISPECIES: hypothetical protein [unclassified Streptomyces]|uniref:hypothetical protein n=1 Tax=unclassified Streptomyces TaxID=2593676 RepID=UPI0033290823
MKQLKDIGPAGAGSKELEAACDEFQHKWGYGIKQIAKATDGVTGKVAKSGQLYQELEDKIEALMKAVQAGGR